MDAGKDLNHRVNDTVNPTPPDTTAPVTTVTPQAGSYDAAQSVILICSDNGAGYKSTYFTTDGSEPTTGSEIYDTA